MALARTTDIGIRNYQDLETKPQQILSELENLRNLFKSDMVNHINNLVKIETGLSSAQVVSKNLGNIIVEYASKLSVYITDDKTEADALNQIIKSFEAQWQQQLIAEGSTHFLRKKPRDEKYEEQNLKTTLLDLFTNVKTAKKLLKQADYIYKIVMNTQSVVTQFIETAEALQRNTPFRLQKTIEYPTLDKTQASLNEIKERLNSILKEQYQLFAQTTIEISKELQKLEKDFTRLTNDKLDDIKLLQSYLNLIPKRDANLGLEKRKLIDACSFPHKLALKQVNTLKLDLSNYQTHINEIKKGEIEHIQQKLNFLNDFLKFHLNDLDDNSRKTKDLNQKIQQRFSTLIEIKAQKKSNTSINTILDAIHQANQELIDMTSNLKRILEKINRQDNDFLSGLNGSMVEPIEQVGIQTGEFNHAETVFESINLPLHQQFQQQLFLLMQTIKEHLNQLNERWQDNKKLIVANVHNESINIKRNIAEQIKFLGEQNLTYHFNAYRLVEDELNDLTTRKEHAFNLLNRMHEFSTNFAAVLKINPEQNTDKRLESYHTLLIQTENGTEDLKLRLETQKQLLEDTIKKVVELGKACIGDINYICIDLNYIPELHLNQTKEKVVHYMESANKYEKELKALTEGLEDAHIDELKSRLLQLNNVSNLIHSLHDEVSKYLAYLQKNLDKLRRNEENELLRHERTVWQRINGLSEDERNEVSDEEKLIFLKVECRDYAEHLQKQQHDDIGVQKLSLINSYQSLLNQEKPAKEKIDQFKEAFCNQQNISLLETRRDTKFVAFLKKVASIIIPDNVLYKVAGDEFMKRISKTMGFFRAPIATEQLNVENNLQARNSP